MVAEPEPLWDQQASQWSRISPPLRPSGDDLLWSQETVDGWGTARESELKALILGMTPELASLDWPPESVVVNCDRSMGMVRALWHRSRPSGIHNPALRTDWSTLPFATRAFHLVLGDGSLNSLPFGVIRRTTEEIRRVLDDDGRFTVRAYIRPDDDDDPVEVWHDLLAGVFPSFHIFKFHLLMSLHLGNGDVRVSDAWEWFESRGSSFEALALCAGRPVEEVATISAYEGQPDIYWFPTLGQLRAALADDFVEESCRFPTYDMGERCPTLVLRAR